ncbi:MAG: ribonuclease R [Verrucomicrobia bacterium]|nr:ribonuclease R [Verrucomicrobiota bacterium]
MPAASRLPDRLLALLQGKKATPLDPATLAKRLRVPLPAITRALHALEKDGSLARVRQNHYISARDADLVTGTIQFHAKGFAFVVPPDGTPDLHIASEDTGTALHGDLVVARIDRGAGPAPRGRRPSAPDRLRGRVLRILERRSALIVGTLQKTARFFVVIPDDPRLLHNLYIPAPGTEGSPQAQPGDKVVAKLIDWKDRGTNPEGLLVERLGRATDPGVDILSIIRKFNLPAAFPPEALAEAESFPPVELPDRPVGREDLRGDFIITIDPDTARDFDDAISLRELPQGHVEVGVHIADVSHYVKPGSELDHEARKRANSVYLVNGVIPMLPPRLSDGLCSLRPNEQRLTYSAFIRLNPEGKPGATRFTRSVIYSRHRLTYAEALLRLRRPAQDDLDRFLQRAWHFASSLRQQRFVQGSLDLDFPELRILLDPQGKPNRIEKESSDESHQLIEEFMLLANESVARHLNQEHRPALYRIHETPDESRLLEYRELLLAHGIKAGDLTQRGEIQKVLKLLPGRPDGYALKIGLLRSLKRAVYSPKSLGHFGLAKSHYTHFTSPIRRYADLLVHRALAHAKGAPRVEGAALDTLAQHLSRTERTAAEAEQESKKLKLLEYFEMQSGPNPSQTFEAIVTEVTNFGMFVELPDFLLSGLIHVSSIQNDFFSFNASQRSLRGRRSGKIYKAGTHLRVAVLKIDLQKRQVDFRPA